MCSPDLSTAVKSGCIEESILRASGNEVDIGDGRAVIEDDDFFRDLCALPDTDTPAPPSRYELRLQDLDYETVQEIDLALREPLPDSVQVTIIAEAERYLGLEAAWTEARGCWHIWGLADKDDMRATCETLGDFARRINKPINLLNRAEELHITSIARRLGRPTDVVEAVYYGGDHDYGVPVHNLWWRAPMPPAGKEPSDGVTGLLAAAVLYQAVCAALADGRSPDDVCAEWAEALHDASEAIVKWRVALCYGEEPEVMDREISDHAWGQVFGRKAARIEPELPARQPGSQVEGDLVTPQLESLLRARQ